MATSLQRQLAALATPSSALLIPERKVSSILFTPQEAAKHKREVFYEIGLDGLYELVKVNPRLFKKFLTSPLFDESSKRYERIVEDREANQKLDVMLEEFLIALSPYLMLKASLKCLEWLVNRFHIEKFNVDLIMECIIPYFDTKTFSLVVQILEVSKQSHTWHWVLPNVKTALPISKADLYAHCNPQFIVRMFSTFNKYIEYHESRPENLRVFISFMTSTFSGVLNCINTSLENLGNVNKPYKLAKVENRAKATVFCLWSQLAKLSTQIESHEELKSNEEIQAMIYVVCTVLFNTVSRRKDLRTPETRSDVKKLMTNILKNHPRPLKTQAYLLLNLLSSVPGHKVGMKKKTDLKRALNEISLLSSDWDLWHLTSKLVLNHVFKGEFRMAPNKLWKTLSAINFTVPQRSELLKSLYMRLYSPKMPKELRKKKNAFLTRFEREYPTEFELACNDDEKFSSNLAKVTRGKNFFLLSQHPSIEIRKEAVRKLIYNFKSQIRGKQTQAPASPLKMSKKGNKAALKVKKKKSPEGVKPVIPDANKTAKALLPRFKDESYEVVHLLIKQDVSLLSKMFSTHTLLEQLSDIVARRDCDKNCLKTALVQLCKTVEQLQPNTDVMSKVFTTLAPFLFPTTSYKFKLSMAVLTSEFAKKNSFLQSYSKLVHNENVSPEDICDFSYDAITSPAAQNFFCQNWHPGGFTSEISAVFALLTWNSVTRFSELIDWVEKIPFTPFSTSWTLTKQSFPKCLRQASTKHSLALELILTTLHRLELKNTVDIERAVTFVLRSCEKLENRNICAGFLKAFLSKHFQTADQQIQFWISMIVSVNKQSSALGYSGVKSRNEFLQIRILQFLYFALKEVRTRRTKFDLGPGFVEVLLTQSVDSDSGRLRDWGLNCLEAFAALKSSQDAEFALFLIGYRGEIIADKEQVPVVVTKALQMDNFLEIRDRFVKVIVDESVEEIIGTGLLKMFRFASSTIFTQFFPMAKELLQTDPSCRKLLAILNCFDGGLEESSSFEILVEALKHKQSCLVMLSKMTPAVFEAYEDATKKKLIALLIDTVLFSKVPEVKVIIQRRVRKWVLEATIISAELDKCIRMEKLMSSAASGATRKSSAGRKNSVSASNSHSVFGDVEWTNRTEVVLEFVQARKRLTQRSKLMLPLFKLLKTCIALEEQSPVEYLKQLILTTLTLCCCEEDVRDKTMMDDWSHFNVDTVIDCLRCSRNPQTHHHALILLNYAARKYPDQVLHGVMSLFTFMGNSILRQDDSYSTQLIQQTVTTIIPTLATERSARKFSKSLVSAGIFRVFTSAVQDIPIHRRLPVFISLVETLNPKETMWQVCVIIIDNALTRDKRRSHLNADMELATDIVWHFDANDVLTALAQVYTYLMDLPIFEKNFTDEKFARVKNTQNPHSKAILDLSRKETLRDAEIVVLFTVELLSKICDKFVELEGGKELSHDALLQKCLSMARLVASNQEDKIMRLIGVRNMEVIEKINAALDPAAFIRVTIAILTTGDNAIKKKMMDLLNQRILHQTEWVVDFSKLLQLIPHFVQLGSSTPETEDQVTLVQTSLLSLKLIARYLAAFHPEEFVPVFELACEHTRHKNKLLRASGLLCLGELFSLKSLILPELADVCSSILRAFKASTKLNSKAMSSMLTDDNELDQEGETSVTTANLLCISAMTCLNKLVEQLGPFLGSSFLQKVLLAVFSIDGIFGQGTKAENRRKVFEQRLKTLLKTISTKLPLRSSITTIKEVFTKLELVEDYNSRSKSLLLLIGLLKETLLITPKADFTTLLPGLCEVFLEQILLHREKAVAVAEESEAPVAAEKLDEVENSLLDCLVSGMVLKLSEGVFRPFYHKMFDWASDSLPRLITFYRFSTMAAEKLKSLFVSFAGLVIHEGSKRLTEDSTLTRAILSYFYQIFLHDREGFITIERFNALVKPLVDMVESEFLLNDEVSIKQLNETLIKLAVASNDLNRWQHMIDLLSLKTRHEDPKVRLFVISTIETAATELGKDFLPLLPPAVPFLAEMLNDDDDKVERETRKMLTKLEDLLGESLQPYFTA